MNFQLSQDKGEEALFSQYLVNFIDDAACCLGVEAQFIYVNEATCNLLGYSRQELLSMTLGDIKESEKEENWLNQWQEIKRQKSYRCNCSLRTKDEQTLGVTITIANVNASNREFYCAVIHPLSPSKTPEISDTQGQQLGELRARFFSTMCHQFRSFLNIISFSNSLLRRYLTSDTETKKLPYLDNIQTAVEQISTLLDKLIFLGKTEVNQVQCEPKPADLDQLCRHLIAQLKPMSDSKQQVIEYICHEDCNSVWIDWELLEQILNNLLTNAIKYSPKSSRIRFELTCDQTTATFEIKDRGFGIPGEELPRIFEPFYRGSNINYIPGTGLGLAIVKNLIDIYGGQIQVHSEIGKGSTFIVTVPNVKAQFPQNF
ncbi:PAS/PAC sensor signal transduction histidine kinase [Gloeothece citriformis PCC 7424]|uniref:histidine kinase n=1 Tax=Gloeothece citriformis (strain PCC 7424) TaxID=65393 RepID=B7KHJ3_GLOC7|nr:HAMP domain-containing sensor histidine kinase [Gloeothece citriformis]ACK70688.1 PAS/PAC sensor signal transduction histidine kinase [Gloeothece citriformis PCC 7424]